MNQGRLESQLRRRLLDGLYIEAMLLADESRAYFDQNGRLERDRLDPIGRVSFSCESLKVTTRLMHVIAWLLTQRAVDAGEMAPADALDPSRRLGLPPVTEQSLLDLMPALARELIESSIDLYRRTARLDEAQMMSTPIYSPARSMFDRLEYAF